MDCFSLEELIGLAEGEAADPSAPGREDHIAACRRCRDDLGLLTEAIRLMRSDRAADAPTDLVQRMVNLFDTVRQAPARPGRVQRIIASLAFDSLAPPALAGVRSLRGLGRQMLFTAEGYDIDLRLSPAEGDGPDSLIGQVLHKGRAAGVANARVALVACGEDLLLTTTDTHGVFSFSRLMRPGSYDFRVVLPDREITINDITLA